MLRCIHQCHKKRAKAKGIIRAENKLKFLEKSPTFTDLKHSEVCMEFSKEEMMEIMAVFKAESAENLQILNDKMKEIAANPSNPAAIEQLHRTSHSMKGTARMLGLTPIEEIGRALEDGFKVAKDGKPLLTPDMIENVNVAVLGMAQLIDKLANEGTTDGFDISGIMQRLAAFK